jgi:hypothetical protein
MSNRWVPAAVYILLLAIVLLSLLVLILTNSCDKAETTVNFPDSDIRAIIGYDINKNTGDIYHSDLANQIGDISSLSGSSDPSALSSQLNQSTNPLILYALSVLNETDSLFNQTGNISSLSGSGYPSDLNSQINQTRNFLLLSSLSSLSDLNSLLNQEGNTSSLSGSGDSSELDALLNQKGSTLSLSSISNQSGLNYGRNQMSDISPMSKSAPASKKNIWLIVGPIAMVAVIAILVDRFLTLRERKRQVPLTPTTGQSNEVESED